MKKYLCFLTLLLLSPYLLISLSPAHAQEKAQAEEMQVTATVDSPVSAEKSKATLNTAETLADPISHPILLNVTLLDKNGLVLPNREVVVTSNRGNVDIIEAISKISSYQVHAAEILASQKDKTDSEGKTSFRITSFIPGMMMLKIVADTVELPSETIKFEPLPFPSNLTISIAIPFSQKEWTIFSPKLQEENLSSIQQEAKKLVNPGTKIKLNFWAFLIILVAITSAFIFIILNFMNLRKIRLMEKEQTLLLKKMFPPNFNRQS